MDWVCARGEGTHAKSVIRRNRYVPAARVYMRKVKKDERGIKIR